VIDEAAAPAGSTVEALLLAPTPRVHAARGGLPLQPGLETDVHAGGPAFDLAFVGWASLFQPTIEGHGWIWLKRTGAESAAVPFRLSGTWFGPVLTDDPDPIPVVSLIPAQAVNPPL
jgi:hypothetical protein